MAVSLSGYKSFLNIPQSPPAYKQPADEIITAFLAISTIVLKSISGRDEDLPDNDPAVDMATYLITKFYTENRDFQERVHSFKIDDLVTENTTAYFRDRLKPAVYRTALGWIYHLSKPTAFIPKVENRGVRYVV